MTTPTGTTPRGYVDRVIVGTAAEVANTVRSMAERGRLVSMTVPHPVPGGKVAVKVRLVAIAPSTSDRTTPPPQVERARFVSRPAVRHAPYRRVATLTGIAAGAVVTLAALGYLVHLVITTLWPLLLAIAVVLYLLRRHFPR